MKFYVLDTGYMLADSAHFVQGRINATMSNPHPCHEMGVWPIECFLIEHEDGYFLFDTSCSPYYKTEWSEERMDRAPFFNTKEQDLETQLAALGVTPDMITKVFVSHLHLDHAGNLYKFKNAEIYVNEDEFTQVVKNWAMFGDFMFYSAKDIERFIQAKLNWHLVPSDAKELKVADGVTLLSLGRGHCFGFLAMRVDLKNTGSILCSSDAIYCDGNINPTYAAPGMCFDPYNYCRISEYLDKYAKANNCRIIYGHDAEQFAALKKAPNEYYD